MLRIAVRLIIHQNAFQQLAVNHAAESSDKWRHVTYRKWRDFLRGTGIADVEQFVGEISDKGFYREILVNASYLFKCLVCSGRTAGNTLSGFFPIKSVITSTITTIPSSGANIIIAPPILLPIARSAMTMIASATYIGTKFL